MISSFFGKVTKMIIQNSAGAKFECLVNPDTMHYETGIRFSEETIPAGTQNPETKYIRKDADRISFKLLIDGTGVIDITGPTAETQITKLKDAVMSYGGSSHQILPVVINWGTILKSFVCRLERISINYKMFTPDGKPLRAEVDLEFKQDTPAKKDIQQRANSSPDLSHLIIAKEGDNLPEMCENIYGNAKMYLEIARINKLINFRHLKAGTEILFPPMEKM